MPWKGFHQISLGHAPKTHFLWIHSQQPLGVLKFRKSPGNRCCLACGSGNLLCERCIAGNPVCEVCIEGNPLYEACIKGNPLSGACIKGNPLSGVCTRQNPLWCADGVCNAILSVSRSWGGGLLEVCFRNFHGLAAMKSQDCPISKEYMPWRRFSLAGARYGQEHNFLKMQAFPHWKAFHTLF